MEAACCQRQLSRTRDIRLQGNKGLTNLKESWQKSFVRFQRLKSVAGICSLVKEPMQFSRTGLDQLCRVIDRRISVQNFLHNRLLAGATHEKCDGCR